MWQGLSQEKVVKRRREFGDNVLPVKEGIPWFWLLLAQFKNPLIYILFFVACVSVFFGEHLNVVLIAAVVVLNVLMGFSQEYNAQKTLVAFQKILKPFALVIREGSRQRIESKELVPGDLVVLGAGDKVSADGQLVEGQSLLVNEAILTGEEEAVEKTVEQDRNNLLMGTIVLAGQGIMEVTAIGTKTQVGQIGQSLTTIKEASTPLQLKLAEFSRQLAKIILGICFLFFLLGLVGGYDFWAMLKLSLVLAVAAIPEGLPIAITVILVLGMRRILKKNGLVKKLLAIEILGSTSVICTDKTGTLTEGVMRVAKAHFTDPVKGLIGLRAVNTQRTNLEAAWWEYIQQKEKEIPDQTKDSLVKVYEEPFDSEKKYSLFIVMVQGKEMAFIAGAPEIILSFCRSSWGEKKKILAQIEDWGSQGLKITGLLCKEEGDLREKRGFDWLGLVGVKDPLREGAREAIELAQTAGIKIKIVTGDFRPTAERVARNLGFSFSPGQVLESEELETISEEELADKIDKLFLFTRVTPHQKLKIVKVLQDKGEVVAMTGDGVNDAPALKKADIGVVLGTGSEVAKEAGDLILLDNNFRTIVATCEEGRLIFSNLKKVVSYVLSNSFAEIILIFGAMLAGLAAPLTVAQILWIHLICDGPPDILLSFEPKEDSLMKKRPQELVRENILSRQMITLVLAISTTIGFSALFVFNYFLKSSGDLTLARTVAFAALATVDLFYIFAFKNLEKLIWQTENFFANKYLFLGVIYGLILVAAAVYVPALNRLLGTIPLRLFDWLWVSGIVLVTLLLIEGFKLISNLWLNPRWKTIFGA